MSRMYNAGDYVINLDKVVGINGIRSDFRVEEPFELLVHMESGFSWTVGFYEKDCDLQSAIEILTSMINCK